MAVLFDSLKEASVATKAKVHGVVTSVSPMKQAATTQFFDAKLVDNDSEIRVVGFSPVLRKRLADYELKKDSLTLNNCKIKKAKYSEDLEILLNPSTEISNSPKKFDAEKEARVASKEISVSDVELKRDYDKVTIRAKVVKVQPPVQLAAGLKKQEVTAADSTGVIKITLWEDAVNAVDEDVCYEFSNFTIRTYKHERYISMPKSSATIQEIGDLGEVAEDDLPEADTVICDATVIAAMINSYSSCVSGCGGKLACLSSEVSICEKCKLEQLTCKTATKTSATLHLLSRGEHYTLTGFHNILAAIVQPEEDITTTNLLRASPFTCHCENNVISSIART